MQFGYNNAALDELNADCLIIALAAKHPFTATAEQLNTLMDGRLNAMLDASELDTSFGSMQLITRTLSGLPFNVLVAGAGDSESLSASRFNNLNIKAARFLRKRNNRHVVSAMAEYPVENLDAVQAQRQALVAFSWGCYLYQETKAPKQPCDNIDTLDIRGESNDQVTAEAKAISIGVDRARELGNLPPNLCNPAYLADIASKIAERHDKVSLEVLDREKMQELGMGALLAVSQGSANPPKLIILNYQGSDASDKPYIFVGKGITFDTGGISLKPGKTMDEMKFDMCGAAGVIGAFESCVTLNLKANLICIVPAVENMPDGNSYRPGDVVTSLSGQTIEVLNTDAEGRLILCDALTYAQRFKPQALIDVATLTGACVIALGKHASGLMTHTEDLAEQLISAGSTTHDRAWRLPIWDDYQSQLDSPFADMANIGGPAAGALTAGCFLSRFTKDVRWAHLDIAGAAWDSGSEKGASGRPVALLTQYMIDRCS